MKYNNLRLNIGIRKLGSVVAIASKLEALKVVSVNTECLDIYRGEKVALLIW